MLEQYLTGIALAYGAFILGILSPGPNILAIMATSMSTSRRAGKALALGVATGSLLWGSLTMFGLTALIALYASLMTTIKIAGAIYLLWLAFKAFRRAWTAREVVGGAVSLQGGVGRYYRRGLQVQMTNPKAALTWIAIMSLALDQNAPLWVGGTVVVGTAAISILVHLSYALAFSSAPMIAAYRRARRWIDGTLGTFFCFASYKIATTNP
ncbi:MAG: LysE family transporter [Alphaproteobacteria bacterium]|nr:LysE family transporter [Alphaproteobacteria bacterium]